MGPLWNKSNSCTLKRVSWLNYDEDRQLSSSSVFLLQYLKAAAPLITPLHISNIPVSQHRLLWKQITLTTQNETLCVPQILFCFCFLSTQTYGALFYYHCSSKVIFTFFWKECSRSYWCIWINVNLAHFVTICVGGPDFFFSPKAWQKQCENLCCKQGAQTSGLSVRLNSYTLKSALCESSRGHSYTHVATRLWFPYPNSRAAVDHYLHRLPPHENIFSLMI